MKEAFLFDFDAAIIILILSHWSYNTWLLSEYLQWLSDAVWAIMGLMDSRYYYLIEFFFTRNIHCDTIKLLVNHIEKNGIFCCFFFSEWSFVADEITTNAPRNYSAVRFYRLNTLNSSIQCDKIFRLHCVHTFIHRHISIILNCFMRLAGASKYLKAFLFSPKYYGFIVV